MRRNTRILALAALLVGLAGASDARAWDHHHHRGIDGVSSYTVLKAGGYGLDSIDPNDELDSGWFVGAEIGVVPSPFVELGFSMDWFRRHDVGGTATDVSVGIGSLAQTGLPMGRNDPGGIHFPPDGTRVLPLQIRSRSSGSLNSSRVAEGSTRGKAPRFFAGIFAWGLARRRAGAYAGRFPCVPESPACSDFAIRDRSSPSCSEASRSYSRPGAPATPPARPPT